MNRATVEGGTIEDGDLIVVRQQQAAKANAIRQGVPPPPKCLQEVGRSLRTSEDGSRDDEQRQAALD